MSGAFLAELVGGALDGEVVVIDELCECGARVGVGAVVKSTRGYVRCRYRISRVEGWRAWAEPDGFEELTFDEVLGRDAA